MKILARQAFPHFEKSCLQEKKLVLEKNRKKHKKSCFVMTTRESKLDFTVMQI
jgi:hypothetical protein